jgi:hypothetical protein
LSAGAEKSVVAFDKVVRTPGNAQQQSFRIAASRSRQCCRDRLDITTIGLPVEDFEIFGMFLAFVDRDGEVKFNKSRHETASTAKADVIEEEC